MAHATSHLAAGRSRLEPPAEVLAASTVSTSRQEWDPPLPLRSAGLEAASEAGTVGARPEELHARLAAEGAAWPFAEDAKRKAVAVRPGVARRRFAGDGRRP